MPSLCRYEEEVALKAAAENEFVVLKKVSDSSHKERNYILDAGCSEAGHLAKVTIVWLWQPGPPVPWQKEAGPWVWLLKPAWPRCRNPD